MEHAGYMDLYSDTDGFDEDGLDDDVDDAGWVNAAPDEEDEANESLIAVDIEQSGNPFNDSSWYKLSKSNEWMLMMGL